jgi:NAD(P) transhydrogenase subunit alpha
LVGLIGGWRISREMMIGVPKEIKADEKRVSSTPETVKKMIADGFKVQVEKDAGVGSFFKDSEYEKAGATIVDTEKVWSSDVVVHVKEPLFNKEKNKHELDMMKRGAYFITFLHPSNPQHHAFVMKMADSGIIGITMDSVPRITRAQIMDPLTSMSTITGYRSVLIAANLLPKFIPMLTTPVGVIKPANVLILGVGVVGLQSLATAKRLGGVVYALDTRKDAREQAKSLGAKIVDFAPPDDIAADKSGYAKRLPPEWLEKEKAVLRSILKDMDIVVSSPLIMGEEAPMLITRDMVQQMRKGSVIVDVAIDQGGTCELTKAAEKVDADGVFVVGTANIPGAQQIDSTRMYAENVYAFLKHISKNGRIELDMKDEITKQCIVTIDGKVVHEGTLRAMENK